MKRFLSVLLAVVLMCTAFAAVAETAAFDKTVLESSALYNYDKFSREWNAQGHYNKEYSDATVRVGLLLFDDYVTDGYGPELRIRFFDKEYQTYLKVVAFRAIVGDKMFCFETLGEGTNCSFAFGGTVLHAFCDALLTGEEVAFQLVYVDKFGSNRTATIDPVSPNELTDLIAMARLMNESNAWSTDKFPELNDIINGATME